MSSITNVGGNYTTLYVVTKVTAKHEEANLYEGDECEVDHDHDASKSCEEMYKCDNCGEVFEYESDASECCPEYQCDFCGETYSGGYYGSARDNAKSCCRTSCDDCGDTGDPDWMSDHECDNGRGMRRALPWEMRGISVDARNPEHDSEWQQAWDLHPENHNVVRAAADYYLLEALKSGLVGTTTGVGDVNGEVGNHTLMTIIRNEAAEMFNALVAAWDPILISYTHMAVGGELRHHNAVGGTVLNSDRNVAWSGWKLIFENVGTDALTDAAELFNEFGGGSFGGKPWADACKILHKRLTGQINPALFLDRIFNAQHNGGCLLNKVQWAGDAAKYAGNFGGTPVKKDIMSVEDMTHTVLPAHGAEPEPDYPTLLAYASAEVVALFNDSHEYARRARLDMGLSLVGVPSKPGIGRTKYTQREWEQEEYAKEKAIQAAKPKSEKYAATLRTTYKQLANYTKYAENEAKQNARIDAKIAATGDDKCDCGDSWCTQTKSSMKSHYYANMVTYYQAEIRTLRKKIAKAKVDEAQKALDEMNPLDLDALIYGAPAPCPCCS